MQQQQEQKTMNKPTQAQIVREAKAKGYELAKSTCTLNGATAYRVRGVPAGADPVNRFALWTVREIGRDLLGYPL
jgi:Tfp pilus assembly protein PilW